VSETSRQDESVPGSAPSGVATTDMTDAPGTRGAAEPSGLPGAATRRVGVIGTLVWDRIVPADGGPSIEAWGGIAYSLAGLAAALPPGWEIVPLVRVGRDLAEAAAALLAPIAGLAGDAALHVVDEPTNRVELRYHDAARRCERLTGGVSAWGWEDLEPRLERIDALFVNFISGFELELSTMESLRAAVAAPIWGDLHSLLLARDEVGHRRLRPLPDHGRWAACFDAIQLNEDELRTQVGEGRDPWAFAADLLRHGPSLVAVTRGADGAVCFGDAHGVRPGTDRDARRRGGTADLLRAAGTVGAGDPTGCGDIWGATAFARLLGGDPVPIAVARANRAAARKLSFRGADGLSSHLAAEDAE
jgi:hypothetical protein